MPTNTRVGIADAARQLFAERGWAGTTMQGVAKAAGVSEPMLYAVCGNKAELAAAEGDPAGQLAAMIGFDCRLDEHGGEVPVVMREAGRSEPALAEACAAGRAADDQLRHTVLDTWRPSVMRARLSRDDAVDSYAALCDIDGHRGLAAERGSPPDRVERWLHHTVCELLIGDLTRRE